VKLPTNNGLLTVGVFLVFSLQVYQSLIADINGSAQTRKSADQASQISINSSELETLKQTACEASIAHEDPDAALRNEVFLHKLESIIQTSVKQELMAYRNDINESLLLARKSALDTSDASAAGTAAALFSHEKSTAALEELRSLVTTANINSGKENPDLAQLVQLSHQMNTAELQEYHQMLYDMLKNDEMNEDTFHFILGL